MVTIRYALYGKERGEHMFWHDSFFPHEKKWEKRDLGARDVDDD